MASFLVVKEEYVIKEEATIASQHTSLAALLNW
jgi:hypothetical protein